MNSKDVLLYSIVIMESIKQFVCYVCGASFTKNKNRLRHVRTKHQGMKRTDNEKRKSEVTDNEAGKQGLLKRSQVGPFGDPVESITQAEFKPPSEYVRMAMEAHEEDRQLTAQEFMQATGLTVLKNINDTFWTALFERPDLYVYVTEEMLSWLGFEGESGNQKKHMLRTLNARSIPYKYLDIDELKKAADQVLEIPTEVCDRPPNYKHLLMRPLEYRQCSAMVQTRKGKEVVTELVKLEFVVHCYQQYEKQVLQVEKQVLQQEKQALQGKNEVLQDKNEALQQEKQHLEGENTSLLKCKADLTTDPLKDLTLKMVMILDEEKFAVIRAQKRHADAYMKKYEREFRGHSKRVVDFKHHPNPMSKWVRLRKLLHNHNKIEKVHSYREFYRCVNNYTLDQLLKDLEMEHKQQCVIVVSQNSTIDSYLKQKPVLHPV